MPIIIPPLITAEDYMAFAQKINPRKEELTIEVLRSFPGCEHYSDEEATELVQSIEQLTLIIFEAMSQNNSICIDNQEVVNLNPGTTPTTIPIKANIKNNAA